MAHPLFERICVLAVSISVFIGCSDLQELHYQNLDAARSDGAFERGWLPVTIPSTSSNIREAHDLDTNEGWLVLDFAPDEYPQLRRMYMDAGWRGLSQRQIDSLVVPEAPVDWWISDTGLENGIDAYSWADDDTGQRWWALVQREKHRLISWHHR